MRILTRCVLCLVFLSWGGRIFAAEWNEYKANHFIIYYKDAPLEFVKNVEDMGERYYVEITENLGFTRYKSWSWDDRMKIYIYRDAQDYLDNAQQAKWSHGAALARSRTIRTFPSAHGFFDSTLPHELGHIIFREFIGCDTQIPLWLEEGVAMYQEKAQRWGSHQQVQQAMEDGTYLNLMQLAELRMSDDAKQSLVELFYAESASAVTFLIKELGEYRFVNFCKHLKDGDSFEKALSSSYGRFHNVEGFNKVWEEYLRK